MKNNDFLNQNKALNPKNFLTSLEALNLPDYKHIGFTIASLCKVAQTALLAEQEYKELTACHEPLDLFNVFQLIINLIPDIELELLDKLFIEDM